MSKLRKAAKGQDCQVRVPGVCSHDPSTVVLAHYRMAGQNGTGIKPSDLLGAYACQFCHMAVDGQLKTGHDKDTLRLYHAEGVMRTLAQLERENQIGVIA